MLFAFNPRFLNSVYMPLALQSKVGCFSVGLPSLGTMLTGLFQGPAPASGVATATA